MMPAQRLDAGQIEVVDDAMAEVLKKKTPAQRIAIGVSLWDAARTLVAAQIRASHPGWSPYEVKKELTRRFINGSP